MNTQPLVSVIIPCYNAQEYLLQCVGSVQNQSYANLEIILIDDGSTDNTSKMCDALSQEDDRIRVIHKQNAGVSQARNTGMSIASGEYIMFLDSDDWIDLETCESAIRAALMNDADIVIWSYLREFASGSKPKLLLGDEQKVYDQKSVKTLHRRLIGLTGEELSAPEHADSLVTVWGKLYRKSVLQGILFLDMSEIGTEDVYFNILVFGNAQSAVYLPKYYNHYRKTNTQSLSTAYTRKIFERWKNLFQRIREYLDSNHMPESYYQALNNRICLGLIGLGTNLAESGESIKHKLSELKIVLSDPIYCSAIKELDFLHLPFKWKVFFFLAKHMQITCLYIMLCIINILRRL